ncbi:hypothetical protein Q3G72_034113 [Acer saccharum]|nr:hypothetical protein Q3G72_034113 [Acer saccharum]
MAKLLITTASYIAQYASAETGSGRTESSLLLRWENGSSSQSLWLRGVIMYHPSNNSDLEWSLQLALRKKDDYEPHSKWSKADDEQDHDAIADGQENEIDTEDIGGMFVFPKVSATISKKVNDHRVAEASYTKQSVGFNGILETCKADDEQDHDAIADGQENEIDTEDIGGMFVFPKVPATKSKKVNDQRVAEASNAKKSIGFNGILETSPQYGHTDSNPVSSEGPECSLQLKSLGCDCFRSEQKEYRVARWREILIAPEFC